LAATLVSRRWVFAAWGAGMALALSFPMSRRSRELAIERPPDSRHLTERFGLLTSLVLGQTLLSVLSGLTGAAAATAATTAMVAALVLTLLCSLWWLYFDDVANSSIRTERAAPFVWVYAHLPLLLGLTTVGAGLRRIVRAEPDATMDEVVRGLLAGGLCLTLL